MLDVVALAVDVSEHRLVRGQVGTIVAVLEPDAVEVEFSDDEGQAYAMVALRADQMMALHFAPARTV